MTTAELTHTTAELTITTAELTITTAELTTPQTADVSRPMWFTAEVSGIRLFALIRLTASPPASILYF